MQKSLVDTINLLFKYLNNDITQDEVKMKINDSTGTIVTARSSCKKTDKK